MSYDASRGVTVLLGGYGGVAAGSLQDTWESDTGKHSRPGHRFTVSWPHALAPDDATLFGLDVAWYTGATGHETDGACAPIDGADLKGWTGLGWTPLAANQDPPPAPGAVMWSTYDPGELESLFHGKPGQETLNFAVTPSEPNGCGPDYGSISTQYVEATVIYRLPAE